MKWMKNEYVIKMIWLWTPLVVNFTKVNSTKQNNVKYQVMSENSLDSSLVTLQPTPTNLDETLQIRLLTKTTSSIMIEWKRHENVFVNKTILGSKVEYFLKRGKFSSHMLQSHINTFTCEHLQASTKYTICVSMYLSEPVYMKENDSVVLSKCFITDTIPYIRSDSILGLFLVLGYYTLMGLVGFWQWKRKCYVAKSKNRRDEVAENNENNVNSTMRYTELEERQRLTNPSCSIEDPPN